MIYIHIPFCRSFCTYCGFYSETVAGCRRSGDVFKGNALSEDYAAAVEAEIKARQEELERVSASDGADTLYVGGGTPSVLTPDFYERILKALGYGGFTEFTMEVNPEDIVGKGPSYVEKLLKLGVNRISMGIQSFDDGILKWMNRRHTAERAVEAYRILESAGVENISIDLIFGLPQLTDALWSETIDKALNISRRGTLPKHISAYQLSVEEGSMVERMIAAGRWSEASDEVCRMQYAVLCRALAAGGYNHYEISNFALPGFEAMHNSAYWHHVPYIGLGPGAHSFMPTVSSENPLFCPSYRTVRQWNIPDLKAYYGAGKCGDLSSVQEREFLDEGQIVIEKVMLGLRTSDGVSADFLRRHCDRDMLEKALATGHLVPHGKDCLRIPEEHFFISDSIISSLV